MPFFTLFNPTLETRKDIAISNGERKQFSINSSVYKVRQPRQYTFAGMPIEFIGYSVGYGDQLNTVEAIIQEKLSTIRQILTAEFGQPDSQAETTATIDEVVKNYSSTAWVKDGYFLMLSSIRAQGAEQAKIWIRKRG